SRRRHTRFSRDWSSDVCSSDLASTSTIRFDLAPAGDATRVNWTMDGEHTFISKVMCIFMDMDVMVGKDFEKGLASLKAESEAAEIGRASWRERGAQPARADLAS